jgi:hypothetical protein
MALAVLVVSVGSCLYAPVLSAARTESYASRFRAAYLPVVATLDRVTPACAPVTRVEQMPACGTRVAPFRVALAHLLQFATHATPPAAAKADVRVLVGSIKVLQQRFTTLAAVIQRKDLPRFKALGGLGHPIDNAINAFVSAIGNLVVDLPGLRIPLPGG